MAEPDPEEEVFSPDLGYSPNMPSNPASTFEALANTIIKNLECCIPVIVTQYNENDRKNHEALVRPLLKKVFTEELSKQLPDVLVSVWRFQVGGFLIDAPLHVGDTGWLIAADRNTALAKMLNGEVQEKDSGISNISKTKSKPPCNSGPQIPNTEDLHLYEQGFFIPDKWGKIQFNDGFEKFIAEKFIIGNVSGKRDEKGYRSENGKNTCDAYIAISPVEPPTEPNPLDLPGAISTEPPPPKIMIHAESGNIDIEADMPNFHLRLNGRNLYSDTNSTWAYYDGAFHNCVYQYAREFYVLPAADENGTLTIGDGCYFLNIPSGTPDKATIVQYPSESNMVTLISSIHNYEDVYKTLVPIGKVLNGVMVQDFRNVTGIAAYE